MRCSSHSTPIIHRGNSLGKDVAPEWPSSAFMEVINIGHIDVPTIKKLQLQNFKSFDALTLHFDAGTNVLIGNNETGKSSVLLALDLALSASRSRVETIGYEA